VSINCVLSEYIEGAMERAEFEKLEDGSYSGSIPICPGVIAFAGSLRTCERELRSVFEDWLFVGLKLGHPLPVIDHVR
jgi:predicted RNase H-like HicB family nuclease